MRKVAIVGFSQMSRNDAPFDDPTFEIWGCNNLHSVLPGKRFTRWYENHPRDYIDSNNKNLSTDHVAWLREARIPVYMVRVHDEFPTSIVFPILDVQDMMRQSLGFPESEVTYLHSTPAMMLAHALLEGVDVVEIYGCDMVVDAEYGYQRANMEAWITLARQQVGPAGGQVRVHVAPKCALMKGMGLYGYDDTYNFALKLEETLLSLRNESTECKIAADAERAERQRQMNTWDGARQACEQIMAVVSQMKRGYRIP